MVSILFFLSSFDILGDKLGMNRTEFPHTVYMVAGTQVSLCTFVSSNVFLCFWNLALSCSNPVDTSFRLRKQLGTP